MNEFCLLLYFEKMLPKEEIDEGEEEELFHFNKKITFYLVSKAAGGAASHLLQRAIKSLTVQESASSHLPSLTDSLCFNFENICLNNLLVASTFMVC